MKEREKDQIKNVIKHLMSKHEGRLFLRALIETSGIFKPIQSSDKEIVMYYEGKRAFGLDVIKTINSENKNNLSILLKSEEPQKH